MSVRTRLAAIAAALAVSALNLAPVAASAPAPDRSAERFEIRFMERTIEHHMMGVAMADLCLQKATPPPPASDTTLRERCAMIRADQSAEAAQLRAWLEDWYGVEFEPKMGMGMLQQLMKAEGEEFDIEVSEMFIEHHLRQIRESTRCLVEAWHRELREFCQHTIDVQSADIVEFREILLNHGEDFRGS